MEKFLVMVDDYMYTYVLIILLAASGIYFTIRTRAAQVRLFGDSFKHVTEKKTEDGKTSSFQALMIATASRVGTGNIAGVCTAIVLGGPGALMWMWIMAVLGSASAFIESTLAQVYKEKDGNTFKGGPAYYIERALKQRWLGVVFAIFLILTFAFGFNGLQSFNLADSLRYYLPNFDHSYAPIVVGGLVALGAGFLFFGGVDKIGKITSILVPIMAALYILVGIIIFFANITELPGAMKLVCSEAFDLPSIFGGFTGSCMCYGIKRGLFSNEAGMGSAPNAAAIADVSHPAKQGLVQVLSVFIDTILICSCTAFIVLLTGQYEVGGELNGIPLIQQCVATLFGKAGIHFITVAIILFAFTSIVGNYVYAENNMKFITKNPVAMFVFRVAAIAMVFFGAQNSMDTAWALADIIMGLMAFINIIAIFALGNKAIAVLKDYEKQRKEGKDPVFKAADVGIENTEFWK